MKKFLDVQADSSMVDDKVIIVDENGNKKECETLFTFDCEENGRSYVGYTDNTYNDNNQLNIYVFYVDLFNEGTELNNVTSNEEIEMVNEVIESILGSLDGGKSNDE